MKKVLLYDSQQFITQLANELINLSFDVFKGTSYGEAMDKYAKENYDFLIIDLDTFEASKFLDNILKLNPKQKIINLSNSLELTTKEGCEACISKYNKKRLLKPYDLRMVYDYLINFDERVCLDYNKDLESRKLSHALSEISEFENFRVKEDELLIFLEEQDKNALTLREFFLIVEILNKYEIKYKIIEQYSLKILRN